GLFDRVSGFLESRRPAAADLVLVGPEYLRIEVESEITVDDLDTAAIVELRVKRALMRYLHPVTGGDGSGWDFGRIPQPSDLYAFIEAIPGVEHIRSLEIRKEPRGVELRGRFLIYAHDQDIVVTTTLEQ